MREILFKAKRKDNGEWVEGYYVRTRLGLDVSFKDVIFVPWKENREEEWGWINIIPETISQYTGLTDKNGKKIWENDILMGHNNPKDIAKVVHGEFNVIEVESLMAIDIVKGWHYVPMETDALSKCEPFCIPMPLTDYYIEQGDFKVIGNIFDNQELLEGGAE